MRDSFTAQLTESDNHHLQCDTQDPDSLIVWCNTRTLLIDDQLVHATRAERSPDGVDDGQAGIDIGQELTLALRRVGTILEKDNLWLLQKRQKYKENKVAG